MNQLFFSFLVLSVFSFRVSLTGLPKMVHSSGTGSYPLPPHGLHLAILLTLRKNPFIAPCFLKASREYCEQVGEYLHAGGVSGEMQV